MRRVIVWEAYDGDQFEKKEDCIAHEKEATPKLDGIYLWDNNGERLNYDLSKDHDIYWISTHVTAFYVTHKESCAEAVAFLDELEAFDWPGIRERVLYIVGDSGDEYVDVEAHPELVGEKRRSLYSSKIPAKLPKKIAACPDRTRLFKDFILKDLWDTKLDIPSGILTRTANCLIRELCGDNFYNPVTVNRYETATVGDMLDLLERTSFHDCGHWKNFGLKCAEALFAVIMDRYGIDYWLIFDRNLYRYRY